MPQIKLTTSQIFGDVIDGNQLFSSSIGSDLQAIKLIDLPKLGEPDDLPTCLTRSSVSELHIYSYIKRRLRKNIENILNI